MAKSAVMGEIRPATFFVEFLDKEGRLIAALVTKGLDIFAETPALLFIHFPNAREDGIQAASRVVPDELYSAPEADLDILFTGTEAIKATFKVDLIMRRTLN